MDKQIINYKFSLVNGIEKNFSFDFDISGKNKNKCNDKKFPGWTALKNEQCPNCPLSVDHCPLAINLVSIIEKLNGISSYRKTTLLVSTKENEFSTETTVLRGMSSLLGIAVASSNCPHMSFFAPMAYFHKPLARAHETVFRSVSSHLLSQHFFLEQSKELLLKTDSLSAICNDLQIVNRYIVKRLHQASEKESAAMAIAILEGYAQALPLMMASAVEEIRGMYPQNPEFVC